MSYIIKQTEVDGFILSTDVEFVFNDGSTELIRVDHNSPQSKDDVIRNIEQREITEQAKIDTEKQNEIIAQELDTLIPQETSIEQIEKLIPQETLADDESVL